MWTDVVDLNEFYRGPLGKTARHMIRLEIRRVWPDVGGDVVAGVGYATPYMKQFAGEAERLIAVMPAYQGVTHWPRGEPNRVALADETALPFADMSIDRLLLVHAVENTEHLRDLMRECWRVLNGAGRLLAVVPARRGLWARSERTPFGHGKPFSRAQFQRLLRDGEFDPTHTSRALYVPPVRWPMLLHAAPAWERIGRRWFNTVGGVLVIEARKQVYAPTPARTRPVMRPRLLPVPRPQPVAGRLRTGD
ncbi:methyltransferase domain-containing protein [Marivibrio halodurans]|uniref:Methyltransferase domain-containing protein n=1 Tax=Marivibrio halodurans TaxID=2039722 RepID=A0A8J7SND5_9PROT|nr:methyltransferase domain-containing protein [Marivibrio halodurans]MBP5857943.1 methyltransferase domain-containing protein [Marivibrio halodurans]